MTLAKNFREVLGDWHPGDMDKYPHLAQFVRRLLVRHKNACNLGY